MFCLLNEQLAKFQHIEVNLQTGNLGKELNGNFENLFVVRKLDRQGLIDHLILLIQPLTIPFCITLIIAQVIVIIVPVIISILPGQHVIDLVRVFSYG